MSKNWIRIIAVLEVIGGLFGVVFLVWQIVAGQKGGLDLVFVLIAFAVYILSFVSGVALLCNRKFGRVGSIIVQFIQLPKYASQLFIFMFSFGFDAYPYFALNKTSNTMIGFELKFLAFNQLFVNVADAPVLFGVSIPASIFLAILLKHKIDVSPSDVASTQT